MALAVPFDCSFGALRGALMQPLWKRQDTGWWADAKGEQLSLCSRITLIVASVFFL